MNYSSKNYDILNPKCIKIKEKDKDSIKDKDMDMENPMINIKNLIGTKFAYKINSVSGLGDPLKPIRYKRIYSESLRKNYENSSVAYKNNLERDYNKKNSQYNSFYNLFGNVNDK